jgi:hypothetical protein
VGIYTYGARNAPGVRPHALQIVEGTFNASDSY